MARWRFWGLMAGGAAVVTLGAAWLTLRGTPPGGVAVLGDAAPALHTAMGTSQTLPVRTAAFTVVSVETWDKLAYMSDMAKVCGEACSGEAGLIRAVALSPKGSRKIVFVNLGAWGLDAAVLGEPSSARACLAETLAAEQTTLSAASVPDCAAEVDVAGGVRWVLPLGLGAL
ncbi:MAG: hypothetical protein AAFU80_11650 [Pseudomonadota bacterium]